MMRRIIAAISAVAALPAIHMSGAVAASTKPVNRPLADQLTRQFNQQELEQLQSGGGTYSQPGAGQLNRQQLGRPGTSIPPPEISRSVMPSPE